MFIDFYQKQKKNNKSYYDCLIPVGGGKDSYWQVHKIINIVNVTKLEF